MTGESEKEAGGGDGAPQGARRGRPRRDSRPEEILDAALAEFAENGFDRTRLDAVARRAGIAKGTLYLYHDSKEALFEAVVRARVSPTLDAVEVMVDRFEGSTEELLRLVLKVFYARIEDGALPQIMRILIAEGARFPRLIDFYHREVLSKGEGALRRILARGVERGELRDGAAARLPQAVMAPGIAAALWTLAFDRVAPIPPDRFLEAHLDLLLNGLFASDPDKERSAS